VGRLADGWLPSFLTAEEGAERRSTVEAEAAAHGRSIDPEHFGALVLYATGAVSDEVLALLGRRRPDADPRRLLAVGLDELRDRIGEFTEVGFSKFVAVPLSDPPGDVGEHLRELADAVRPLET
jgi:alkanesulfonate monooxygenase SsuD/methylene tetrahydromethanopterin reductase-like flavin-dependent oxidoreductase (luciferase family)